MNTSTWIRNFLLQNGYFPDGLPSTSELRDPYDTFLNTVDTVSSFASFRRYLEKERKRYLDQKSERNDNNKVVEAAVHLAESDKKDPYALAKKMGIDLSLWDILDCRITQQTVYGKEKIGDLMWDEGRMTGKISYSGRSIEPVYHVKFHLVRKVVRVQAETLTPIVSKNKYSKKFPKVKKGEVSKAAIISDYQASFYEENGKDITIHDPRVMDAFLYVIKKEKPDTIILNGDMLDLTDWSDKFVQSPAFSFQVQKALNHLFSVIAVMRQEHPESRIIYIQGNHEFRMERLIQRNLPVAYGLRRSDNIDGFPVLSIPYLLGLDSLGVQWFGEYPKGRVWLADNLCVSHSESGKTNMDNILRDLTHTEIMGHTHRHYQKWKTIYTSRRAEVVGLISFGMAARMDEVVPAAKSRNDWQQGFGIVEYINDHHKIHAYHINDGKLMYNGKLHLFDGTSGEGA